MKFNLTRKLFALLGVLLTCFVRETTAQSENHDFWLTTSAITTSAKSQEAEKTSEGNKSEEDNAKPDDPVESSGTAKAGEDRTEDVLEEWRQLDGRRELGKVQIDKIVMHLHITAPAEAIIAKKAFDLPDDKFELSDFTTALSKVFSESVGYFMHLVPESPVREFHVVIHDLGEARKSTSAQAKRNSRAIRLDLRRWHKMYRGQRSYLAGANSIHEFTHIVNYFLDSHEDQFHRELTAILFELMNFTREWGMQAFEETYLKVARLKSPEQVLSKQFTEYPPLRHIAHAFVRKVLDGTYPVDVADEKRGAAIERFAALYLASTKTGSQGFDEACQKVGIKDATGTLLTLEKVQADLYAELTR